jgi:hypothetical protein
MIRREPHDWANDHNTTLSQPPIWPIWARFTDAGLLLKKRYQNGNRAFGLEVSAAMVEAGRVV